jgi:hypothetical protein
VIHTLAVLVMAATVATAQSTPAGSFTVTAKPAATAAQQMAIARDAYSHALRDFAPRTDGRHRGVAGALTNLELLVKRFSDDRAAVGAAFLFEAEIFDHESAYKNVLDVAERGAAAVAHTPMEPLLLWHKANALSQLNQPDDADVVYAAAKQGQFERLDTAQKLALLNSAAYFHSRRGKHEVASDELRAAAGLARRPFTKLDYMLRSLQENVASNDETRARADAVLVDRLIADSSAERLSPAERAALDDHIQSFRAHRARLHL